MKLAVVREGRSRQDKKEALYHMADGGGGPCGISPVCARPLRRQLHPIHRVVAVVVHDLRQAEVCDLDLTTRRAVHQQDVACGGAESTEQTILFKIQRVKHRHARRLIGCPV